MGEVSVLDTRPSSAVDIFPETSRMDLHPAPGSFLQELYRHTLLVRPHAHDSRDSRALEETTSAWPADSWQLVKCTGKYEFVRVSAPTTHAVVQLRT